MTPAKCRRFENKKGRRPLNVTKDYVNPRELALKLGVSLKAISKWTAAGRIPGAVKIGRVWRYRIVAVEKALLSGNLLVGSKG